MKLRNETAYPTRTLRAIVTECHRRHARTEGRLRTWGLLTVTVGYTRTRDHGGRASLGGTWALILLPRGGVDAAAAARIVDHELLHSYGYRHKAMACSAPRIYHSPEYLERFAWARLFWGDVILEAVREAKPRRPVREVRRERIAARLGTWERRLKRAQRMVAKLRQKARYYNRALPAAAAPAKEE